MPLPGGGGSPGGIASTTTAATPQYPSWITDILTGVGAPINATTADNLTAWNQCEGNKAGGSGLPINNPFNTTLRGSQYPGSVSVNSAPVQWYPTYQEGINATVNTMLYTNAFKPIVQALQQSADRATFAAAVGDSGWGTSGSCIASAKGAAGGIPNGNGTGDTGGAAGSSSTGTGSTCVVKVPLAGCILTDKNLKALRGGLLVVGGAGVFLLGALVLFAGGFQASGAQRALSTVSRRGTPTGVAVRAVTGAAPRRARVRAVASSRLESTARARPAAASRPRLVSGPAPTGKLPARYRPRSQDLADMSPTDRARVGRSNRAPRLEDEPLL